MERFDSCSISCRKFQTHSLCDVPTGSQDVDPKKINPDFEVTSQVIDDAPRIEIMMTFTSSPKAFSCS